VDVVDADHARGAVLHQQFTDHAVAGADVQHAHLRRIVAILRGRVAQQVGELGGRGALQALVEQLLVQARVVVDVGVIVKGDAALLAVLHDREICLGLAGAGEVVGRKTDVVALRSHAAPRCRREMRRDGGQRQHKRY